MTDFTFREIARIVGGKLLGEALALPSNYIINKVVIDSRTFYPSKNTLFFALTGPRNNGHNYIPELISKGVKVFVVSNASAVRSDASFILVENTTVALQKLAAYKRQQYNYPVVGITGSNGKTIVKEWLHDILADEFRIVRNPKSYNSQIGVPLSILLMNGSFELAIFEAGISMPGEMEKLAPVIQPNIGIFTNIGDAHQENFNTLEQKVREKLKLLEHCKQLVYRIDAENSGSLVTDFCDMRSIEKISWSLQRGTAKIIFSAKKSEDYTTLSATIDQQSYRFTIPFTDDSSIENACHCFAAATVISKNLKEILPQFSKFQPVEMRLEIKQGINNCLLVNDYYNSDLNSLSIALSVLHQQAVKEHLYKQVILSDIQQSGFPVKKLYEKVNELLTDWQIDELIGIGPALSAHEELFAMKTRFFVSRAEFERQFNRNDYHESAILIKGARQFEFEKISALLQQKAHQTRLEINLNALVNNLNVFRGLLKPDTKIMVMVKAFSYGSGDVEIAKSLQYQNVDYLAVAIADEGVQLRNAGITTPIIVMNPEIHSFQHLIDFQLEPNLYSIDLLRDFTKSVSMNGLQNFPVHLKIDTGMNRLGLKTEEEIKKVIDLISSHNHVRIQSVFSHLAGSDDVNLDGFTKQQIERFEYCSALISKSFNYKIDRHILNSAGIERFPEKQFEMIRLGIGLYGISATGLPLENIGTLKSTISQVKKVRSDETIGYSRKGQIDRESEIAIVPLGYADGLDRKLGNHKGVAFVLGKKVPIIGNICMDMLMLDVTGSGAKAGDEVEIFGGHISISEVAEQAATIPYEILTGISQRVKRVYLQE